MNEELLKPYKSDGRYVCLPIKNYNIIKQALTPPTADEVCKALSEHFEDNKHKIVNLHNQNSFYLVYDDEEDMHYHICGYNGKEIKIDQSLPPHLITLIGKFYENEQGSDIE